MSIAGSNHPPPTASASSFAQSHAHSARSERAGSSTIKTVVTSPRMSVPPRVPCIQFLYFLQHGLATNPLHLLIRPTTPLSQPIPRVYQSLDVRIPQMPPPPPPLLSISPDKTKAPAGGHSRVKVQRATRHRCARMCDQTGPSCILNPGGAPVH